MLSNKLKRSINVDTESEFSDSESDESFWEIQEKISSKNSNKRMKPTNIISSDLNQSFQNTLSSKMATRKYIGNQNINKLQKVSAKGSFSRNALMARENRLKKKLYIQNLEKNVEHYKKITEKLYSRINKQSAYIENMKKEVKYYKNIIANSKDINKILQCINLNTGLPVTSSLKSNTVISNTPSLKTHPWCDDTLVKNGELYSSDSYEGNLDLDTLFSDVTLPIFDEQVFDVNIVSSEENNKDRDINDVERVEPMTDHNYTVPNSELPDVCEDVGICLHVSNHRVSLEFCPMCSEKATNAWKKD